MKHKQLKNIRNVLMMGLMAIPVVIFSIPAILFFQPFVWLFSELSWQESGEAIIVCVAYMIYG